MTCLNLAELPQNERDRIEADKAACLIRHETNRMGLKARREHAKMKLDRMPGEQRAMVLAALTARAGT
jgi:hypothetical protein